MHASHSVRTRLHAVNHHCAESKTTATEELANLSGFLKSRSLCIGQTYFSSACVTEKYAWKTSTLRHDAAEILGFLFILDL